MTTTFDPADEREPDPDDWPTEDPESLSPEAVVNSPDDIAAALPEDAPLPTDVDEADALDQRVETGLEDEDDPEEA